MLVLLVLIKINQHFAAPVLAIANRWLRWLVIAGTLAMFCQHFGWDDGRSYWALFAVFLLIWLLLDGVYRWLAIQAMSVSPLPLFPRFTENRAGDEWPVQRRFLTLRDQLRAAGFKQVQALRAEVATGIYVRASIYQDAGQNTRLQVSFLPQPGASVLACLHFSTCLATGERLVTDNHHLPFAGFYPETWSVERRPRTRGFKALYARHRERVAASRGTVVPWATVPMDDLNAQQTELERLNTDMGFLLPPTMHEEHGRISHEGRYRVWKEMLMLDYLGRAARYE